MLPKTKACRCCATRTTASASGRPSTSVTVTVDAGSSVCIASGARNDELGHVSDLAHPAVDDEFGAGDEARLFRREEEHRRGDLVWTADASDRDLFRDAGDGVLVAVEEVREALGGGRPGADRVGTDVPMTLVRP